LSLSAIVQNTGENESLTTVFENGNEDVQPTQAASRKKTKEKLRQNESTKIGRPIKIGMLNLFVLKQCSQI